MKTIKVKYFDDVPKDFTGIAKYTSGTKQWLINGQVHREDGPAIEYPDGEKWWYLNGKMHREDGPAVEYADGTKRWFLDGYHVGKENFEKYKNLKKMNYSTKLCLFFIGWKYDENDINVIILANR